MGKGDGLGSVGGLTHQTHGFTHNRGFGVHNSTSFSSIKPSHSSFLSSSNGIHAGNSYNASGRPLTEEELALIQQRQANKAAVQSKLDMYPNLKSYIDSHRGVAIQLWNKHEVIRRMNEEPSLMAEMDANPESQIQSLFSQYPYNPPQQQSSYSTTSSSSCCTIV